MTTTHDQTMNAIGGAILTAVANESPKVIAADVREIITGGES